MLFSKKKKNQLTKAPLMNHIFSRTSPNGATDKLQTKEDHHLAAFLEHGIMVPFFSSIYKKHVFKHTKITF